jgi:hypothetical protein
MITPFRNGETDILVTTLAERLGVHSSTPGRWRQSGKLECIKIGGRWFVTPEAWERFVDLCNAPQEPAAPAAPKPTSKQRQKELERAEAECASLRL